jgi:hypothetical protein
VYSGQAGKPATDNNDMRTPPSPGGEISDTRLGFLSRPKVLWCASTTSLPREPGSGLSAVHAGPVTGGCGRGRAFPDAAGGGPGVAGVVVGLRDLRLPLHGIDGGEPAGDVDTLTGAPGLRAGHVGFSFCSVVHDYAARR